MTPMPEDAIAVAPLHRRVRLGLRHGGNWRQLVRFALVGASGFAVNLAVFTLLVHGPPHADYRLASVLAYLVAVSNNFALNRHWTFSGEKGRARAEGARFFTVSLGTQALSLVVLQGLVDGAGVGVTLAQALAVVCATPASFLANRLWSFAR
jgi:putative flippase GtrA